MALSVGFEKVSAAGKVGLLQKGLNVAGQVVKEAPGIAKATYRGAGEGAAQSVSHHLKLKGFGDAVKHVSEAGGLGKAVSSAGGRRALGQAAGKALPSAVAAGAYASGAKKLYDSALGDKQQSNYYG